MKRLNCIRVGIIGSGFIAKQKHLPAWKKAARNAQVVALSDPNVAQAEELASAHGISKVYKDYEQMLEAERLDVVDICSPPRTHAELAIRSLQSGAHALIEKPMAINTAECDQILAVAKEHGRKICIAHSDLFYPSFLKAREIVKKGTIGDFAGMRIFLSTPVDYITSKPDHWAHRLPGGVIGETGPHVIYMALAFINPIQRVRVEARKQLKQFPWSPYEDYRLDLMGESATCSVALTYATNRWAVQLGVCGEHPVRIANPGSSGGGARGSACHGSARKPAGGRDYLIQCVESPGSRRSASANWTFRLRLKRWRVRFVIADQTAWTFAASDHQRFLRVSRSATTVSPLSMSRRPAESR